MSYGTAGYRRNRRAVLEAAGWRCHYCGRLMPANRNATADHVIPKARGGSDSTANLVACCRSCNSRRGAELLNTVRRFAGRGVGRRSRAW